MSRHGAPTLTPTHSAAGERVVIVASSWHDTIMNGLIAGAQRVLDEAGVAHRLVRAPGSFELPVISQAALAGGADAVVALGVIIRGGTPHFEYVSDATTQGILRVSLDAGRPVGFGVLTCDNEQQALDRAGLHGSVEDKGAEAAEAALVALAAVRDLHPAPAASAETAA
ncbi:6,7-dimethyl-8-ribityllumazine synthase [Micrococcales bacterium 31B]|nr:6,7-dimethyl-8-ribityllumazine synthase [Micrococcales bacterium 31B]